MGELGNQPPATAAGDGRSPSGPVSHIDPGPQKALQKAPRRARTFDRWWHRLVQRMFFRQLIKTTRNFDSTTWMGHTIWQNVLDVWTIQETITAIRPELLIETGTNRGGSSFFYGQLMDLLGFGSIITVDIEKLHDLKHPRVTYMLGSSTDAALFREIAARARACTGPVMVILDSDHAAAHVAKELELYPALVTPGSYCLVQDGVIDEMPLFRSGRPGPLKALRDWLPRHPEFEVDHAKCRRFLVTHHPEGWLKRVK